MLRDIVKEQLVKSVVYSNTPIKLASGGSSSHYLDCRRNLMTIEGQLNIGQLMSIEIAKLVMSDFHSGGLVIGGMATGAIPLICSILHWITYTPIIPKAGVTGIYVRSEQKEHGLQNLIEGSWFGSPQNNECIVVEDVTTTGGSLIKAITTIREKGFTVKRAISLVDREPSYTLDSKQECALDKCKEIGIEFHSIFGLSEILDKWAELHSTKA